MSDFVKKQYKAISKIGNIKAKNFFLKSGYFTETGILPGIINVSGLKDIKLQKIEWNDKKSKKRYPFRTHPIKISMAKGGKGQRIFGLMHPYIYIHLVNEITQSEIWSDIIAKLSSETKVLVYSLPLFGEKKDKKTFDGWKYFSIIDFQTLSLGYNFEVCVDIKNFYSSVYTHSISWAVLGKEIAKDKVGNFSLICNRLDKLLQNANDGQTNGILIGNEVSNIIAELILKDIDEIISKEVSEFDVKILRYRDDYKFLCKDQYSAKVLIDKISKVLSEEYGFTLNDLKTKIYEHFNIDLNKSNHIAQCILDKYFNTKNIKWNGEKLYNFLKDVIESHCYLKDKNYLDNQISKLLYLLRRKKIKISSVGIWAKPIVSIMIKAINNQLTTGNYGFALLTEIVSVVKKESKKIVKEIIDTICVFYIGKSNDVIDLWVYIICKGFSNKQAKIILSKKDSAIFQMIKNKSVPDIHFFKSRDKIDDNDLIELEKFKLLKTENLDLITEKTPSFINTLKKEEFENWIEDSYNR